MSAILPSIRPAMMGLPADKFELIRAYDGFPLDHRNESIKQIDTVSQNRLPGGFSAPQFAHFISSTHFIFNHSACRGAPWPLSDRRCRSPREPVVDVGEHRSRLVATAF